MKALAEQLKIAREEAGMTVWDVSDVVLMNHAGLSRLENGHHMNPTLRTLVRMADVLGKQLEIKFTDK